MWEKRVLHLVVEMMRRSDNRLVDVLMWYLAADIGMGMVVEIECGAVRVARLERESAVSFPGMLQ